MSGHRAIFASGLIKDLYRRFFTITSHDLFVGMPINVYMIYSSLNLRRRLKNAIFYNSDIFHNFSKKLILI